MSLNLKDIFIPSLKDVEKVISEFKVKTPFFLTNKEFLKDRVKKFKNAFNNEIYLYYAMKANFNEKIILTLKDFGIDGIDAVSPGEVEFAKKLGFSSEKIMFTGNNSSKEELFEVKNSGATLNLGSISELRNFSKMFTNSEISLRINPDIGDGESKGVITGGKYSKFGLRNSEMKEAFEIIKEFKMKVIGIHCHIGSGFYKVDNFQKSIQIVTKEAKNFENLKFVDFGGGFGIRYKPNQDPIDLSAFYESIKNEIEELKSKNIKIIFEPGKYLVGESTVLITEVTTIKKSDDFILIGTNTGFNHLIRPAFYGSYHHIINLSEKTKDSIELNNTEKTIVFGNICESSDEFGTFSSNHVKEGDKIAILTSGAYGSSMSMIYNLRPHAKEILI